MNRPPTEGCAREKGGEIPGNAVPVQRDLQGQQMIGILYVERC